MSWLRAALVMGMGMDAPGGDDSRCAMQLR